jgi:hypothetical protein
MTIQERIIQLKKDNMFIYTKALGNNTELFPNDWICIWNGRRGDGKLVYSLDVKDMDTIPDEIMQREFDFEEGWFIGSEVSLDLCTR